MLVEVPGLNDRTSSAFDLMRPPEPRGMADYLTAPCKHEWAIFKQRRHIREVHSVLVPLDPIRSALKRAYAGQCGVVSSCCTASTVEAVVGLDHPCIRSKDEASESALLCAATIHRFGIPYHYVKLESSVLPEVCA